MTIADETAKGQTEAISFVLELSHPPEKVWRALTDPALLAEWLLPATGFGLDPGVEFTFQAPPLEGWDGKVHCRVLECEPGRRLRYGWVVGDMDTVVTFTLDRTASGTRLSLVHSGFTPQQKQNFGGARYGWRMMTGRLVDLIERIS